MSRTTRQTFGALLGIALLIAVALLTLRAQPSAGGAAPSAVPTPRSAAQLTRAPQATALVKPTRTSAASRSGLPTARPADLPPEARTTLRLIAQGGPFPYSRDGVVFQNREGRLPKRAQGYYHEYTVVTPGEDDRGARRVIAGSDGELFYTGDHYASFVEVLP